MNVRTLVQAVHHKDYFIKILLSKYKNMPYDLAEDHFSEAICKLLEKYPNSTTITSQLIIRCMVNNTINAHRRPKDIRYLDNLEDVETIKDIQWFTYDNVRKEIYKLKGKRRTVLILKFRFKLKKKEIANFLEIPLGTASTDLRQAQIKLRNLILTPCS